MLKKCILALNKIGITRVSAITVLQVFGLNLSIQRMICMLYWNPADSAAHAEH